MEGKKNFISFSGGKDSTAMLHLLIENKYPFDDVIFFDTGWEFPEMYDHISLVEQKTGIKITVVQPTKPFEYYLSEHIVKKGKHAGINGYGWPWAKGRWCTGIKCKTIDKLVKDNNQYIGIAADEKKRCKDNPKYIYPIVDLGYTEKQCLEYCYSLGYTWGGLYEQHSRVSCFCCPLQGTKSIKWLYTERPELWNRIKKMDRVSDKFDTPSLFHGRTIKEWEERFQKGK